LRRHQHRDDRFEPADTGGEASQRDVMRGLLVKYDFVIRRQGEQR
jgi:hypothetical protein